MNNDSDHNMYMLWSWTPQCLTYMCPNVTDLSCEGGDGCGGTGQIFADVNLLRGGGHVEWHFLLGLGWLALLLNRCNAHRCH